MANRTNYYSDGKTIYQADDFRAPWAAALTDGVLDGYKVSADSPADLVVSVSAGVANHVGYISRDDAPTPVEILANTSGYNRLDLIVLDFDETNFATTLKDIQGIPSSNPVVPVTASNQIVLAQITVGNNASVIDSNVITDARVMSVPKITGVKTVSNANGIAKMFPDGTMICWAQMNMGTDANGIATWTYPASFLAGSTPYVGMPQMIAGANGLVGASPFSITEKSAQLQFIKSTCNLLSTTYIAGVNLFAIGLWKQ